MPESVVFPRLRIRFEVFCEKSSPIFFTGSDGVLLSKTALFILALANARFSFAKF